MADPGGFDAFDLMGGMACDAAVESEFVGPVMPRADPEEQARQVAAAEAEEQGGSTSPFQGIQAGKVYYLINHKWYSQWQSYTKSPQSSEEPGPITNKPLLETVKNNDTLKKGLHENQDFAILSSRAWELLFGWYTGGPAIPRRAVSTPSGLAEVEIYCLRMMLHKSSEPAASPTPIFESKQTLVEEFKRRACEEMGVEPSRVRLWDHFQKKWHANLENKLSNTLDSCNMVEDNDIMLEEQKQDGSWPSSEAIDKRVVSTGYGSNYGGYSSNGTPLCVGSVGLQNLGNTCFMNSSIQCLSSVEVFRDHFRMETFRPHLNRQAFKTQGKLAEAFSQLMKEMWAEGATQVAPREFKYQIGQFAEQFTGYRQHDSMEFIEYLLDGLKEDLNSVRGQKPFVELKEAEGRPDDEVAREAEENYRKRNNSYIDDLFLGLYKSTVQCTHPGCDRVSVKFDPFLSIKVPLTNSELERKVSLNITVVARGDIKTHKVQVSKSGSTKEVVEAAAQAAGIPAEGCVLVEVYLKKIFKWFDNNDSTEKISSNDVLVLYEVDEIVRSAAKTAARSYYYSSSYDDKDATDQVGCVVYLRKNKPSAYSSGREFVGMPLPLTLPRESPADELKQRVQVELEKYIKPLPEGWSLFWTAEKNSIESSCTEVRPGQDTVRLQGRGVVYIVVEWPEDSVPQAVIDLGEAINSSSGGSNGYSSTPEPTIKLEECIKLFTETDRLSADDAWYCNKCKEHREALKKMEFWSLPPVLLLQLKRFTYTSYSRDRIDTNVAFPLEGLDMTPFVMQGAANRRPQIFDLVSLSLHGGSQTGGHYVAYGRSSVDGKWYYYNDSWAKEVEPSEVAREQSGAYVLFYLRRDQRPTSWGTPLS